MPGRTALFFSDDRTGAKKIAETIFQRRKFVPACWGMGRGRGPEQAQPMGGKLSDEFFHPSIARRISPFSQIRTLGRRGLVRRQRIAPVATGLLLDVVSYLQRALRAARHPRPRMN